MRTTLLLVSLSLIATLVGCGSGSDTLPTPTPSPFVVNHLGDVLDPPEGVVTLRSALEAAESNQTITFAETLDGGEIQLTHIGDAHSVLKGEVMGIREDDIVFSVAKMFFAYGLGNAVSFPLAMGATTVIFGGRPTPESVLDIMAEQKPTIFCGVPTLYAALVAEQDKRATKPEHSIRLCASAGEALPRDIGLRWEALWGAEIVDGVGSTEMLHIFLSNRPGDVAYGTSGIAVPGYEVRLVDEHDEDVAEDDVGELLVRGPSSADGYWNKRDKSQSTFQGHWTRTGDKYERTKEGRYVYCGRTDDMFKVSGIWVSPFEVEQALVEFPSILEAAVVARADDKDLVKPAAFIVLNEGETIDLDALKEHVKAKIGMWKYPRWVTVVDDLPKTATGKIQRFKLRENEGAT